MKVFCIKKKTTHISHHVCYLTNLIPLVVFLVIFFFYFCRAKAGKIYNVGQ